MLATDKDDILKPHNVRIYEQFHTMLDEENKAILIGTTGSGKSYVTKKYLKSYNMRGLVICPRTSICEQWDEVVGEPLCSTMTFQKFSRIKDFTELDEYDCFIFDEAHHSGSKVWGAAVKRLMKETDKPVLGLTADPHRYSDHGRDVSVEVWDGCIVYGYSQEEAIKMGILPPVKYVCALFNVDKIVEDLKKHPKASKIDKRLIEKLEYTAKNCQSIQEILHQHNVGGKRKGIVFTENIDATGPAEDLMRSCYPYANILTIHSKIPKRERKERYEAFKELDDGYMICVDMMNEGVHAPGANTGIMLRKTESFSVFLQQCGRVMSTDAENVIIFDFVGNHSNMKFVSKRIQAAEKAFFEKQVQEGKKREEIKQIIINDYASDFISIVEEVKRALNDYWNQTQDEILRQFYAEEGSEVAKRLPGKTRGACYQRARKLGLQTRKDNWSQEELDILDEWFPLEGRAVCKRLPDRTEDACVAKAKERKLRSKKTWTKQDEDFLRKELGIKSVAEIAQELGRTESSVRNKASKMGIYAPSKAWTDAENEIIRALFPYMGIAVAEKLPGRTGEACQQQAKKLQVKREKEWTTKEEAILQQHYPTEGKSVAKRLPNRTEKACVIHAQRLGIRYLQEIEKTETETPKTSTQEQTPAPVPQQAKPQASAPQKIREKIKQKFSGWRKHKVTGSLNNAVTIDISVSQEPKPAQQKENMQASPEIVRKRWSTEEDEILRQFYPTEGAAVAKRLSDRTETACVMRANALGINTNDLRNWTKEEDDILREYYPKEGGKVVDRLPGRSVRACNSRATKLKIKTPRIQWSEEEDEILYQFYPTEGTAVSSRLHGRTKRACQNRAFALGITVNEIWTAEEDDIIRKYYPEEGTNVKQRLPGKTSEGCRMRAKRIGVKFIKK